MELLSDSFQSESDSDCVGNRRIPTKFGSDLVSFHRVPSNSDEIRVGFRLKRIDHHSIGADRFFTEIVGFRRGSDRFGSNLPVGLDHLG